MIDMTGWVQIISGLGFPIAVAVYLIVEQRKRIQELTEEITKLRIAIILLAQRMDIDLTKGGAQEGSGVNLVE